VTAGERVVPCQSCRQCQCAEERIHHSMNSPTRLYTTSDKLVFINLPTTQQQQLNRSTRWTTHREYLSFTLTHRLCLCHGSQAGHFGHKTLRHWFRSVWHFGTGAEVCCGRSVR